MQTFSNQHPLTFQQVRRQHQLTLEQLALKAGVPARTVYALEIGARVSWSEAIDCLHALSVLVGRYYQLHDFAIRIREEAIVNAPTLPLHAIQRRER
jgi:DNA-binding XRE family transcriptional regulator